MASTPTTVVGECVGTNSGVLAWRSFLDREDVAIIVGGTATGALVVVVAGRVIVRLLCFGVMVVDESAAEAVSESCCDFGCGDTDRNDTDGVDFRKDRTTNTLSCFWNDIAVACFTTSLDVTTVVGILFGLLVWLLLLPLLLLLYSQDASGMIAGIVGGCCDDRVTSVRRLLYGCEGKCKLSSLCDTTDSESDCVMDSSSMVGSCSGCVGCDIDTPILLVPFRVMVGTEDNAKDPVRRFCGAIFLTR